MQLLLWAHWITTWGKSSLALSTNYSKKPDIPPGKSQPLVATGKRFGTALRDRTSDPSASRSTIRTSLPTAPALRLLLIFGVETWPPVATAHHWCPLSTMHSFIAPAKTEPSLTSEVLPILPGFLPKARPWDLIRAQGTC